jgi:hypothetical protein
MSSNCIGPNAPYTGILFLNVLAKKSAAISFTQVRMNNHINILKETSKVLYLIIPAIDAKRVTDTRTSVICVNESK